ncbi:MAG: ribbon-helix-helix domain-containing protein [Clostridiales bacterium]|nr:ribbon-helix-helix domain-containing protein [Clostridiales bacterium]
MSDARFSVTMSEELYQEVDQFRHSHKYKTQTKAVVALVEKGLNSLGLPEPLPDGGVSIADARSTLMEVRFSQLDDQDKASVYSYAGYLLEQEKYKQAGEQAE